MQTLASRIVNMHKTLGQWRVRKHKGRLLNAEQVSRALMSNDPIEIKEQHDALCVLSKAVITKSEFYSEWASELLEQIENLSTTKDALDISEENGSTPHEEE